MERRCGFGGRDSRVRRTSVRIGKNNGTVNLLRYLLRLSRHVQCRKSSQTACSYCWCLCCSLCASVEAYSNEICIHIYIYIHIYTDIYTQIYKYTYIHTYNRHTYMYTFPQVCPCTVGLVSLAPHHQGFRSEACSLNLYKFTNTASGGLLAGLCRTPKL